MDRLTMYKACKECGAIHSNGGDYCNVCSTRFAAKLKNKEEGTIEATITIEPVDYVKRFLERDANECLVVFGSIYLLGEVKSKLLINHT